MNKLDIIKNLAFYLTIKTWNLEINLTGLIYTLVRIFQYTVLISIAFFIDLLVLTIAISYLLVSWFVSQIYENLIKPILNQFATQLITLSTRIATFLILVSIVILLIYRFDVVKMVIINIFDNLI